LDYFISSNGINDVFIDPYGKVNHLYDENVGGNWLHNDGLSTFIFLTPNNFNSTYYGDACIKNGNTYVLFNHFTGAGENDSILIKSVTTQVVIESPMRGLYSNKSITVDHANRIWVAKMDSVFMYNGNAWTGFSLNGLNAY